MKPTVFATIVLSILFAACDNNGGSTITETGTLEANEVTVSTQVNGLVQAYPVEEGAILSAGDTLAVIDSREWRLQLAQAEANRRAAEAQYTMALEGPRKEDLAQGKANYENASSDLQRMEELFRTNSIPKKNLDDARTRFTVAQQMWEKLRRGSRKEELELAGARRDQAAAQMAQLKKKVDDCTITAPIGGTLINRFVEPGEFVVPGSSVGRLANLDELEINIYVAEAVLPRIKLGQNAFVAVDAFSEKQFEARVVYLSPTAEFTPKNIQTKDERVKLVFAVKLKVKNTEGQLKAGLPADVTLNLEETGK